MTQVMRQALLHNDGKVHTGYYPNRQYHIVYMECAGEVREVYFPTHGDAIAFLKRINVYGKLRGRLTQ